MGEAEHECMGGVVEEISISSTYFCCEPKTALKRKKSSLFKKNVHVIKVKWHE